MPIIRSRWPLLADNGARADYLFRGGRPPVGAARRNTFRLASKRDWDALKCDVTASNRFWARRSCRLTQAAP
jgi:hypothetical protein